MKAQLLEEKPNTFQVDTTFDTKRENFTVFKSETTGQWEIGCLLYIETETKTNNMELECSETVYHTISQVPS
jgi:hypothetical protein